MSTPRTLDLRIPATVACPRATPDPESPDLRRLRHLRGLARQHHRRGPDARRALGHRRRLAGAGRRLARALSARAGRGAIGPPPVDDPRRPASRVARRARPRVRSRQARRDAARSPQPRLASADPVARHGGGAGAAQAPFRDRPAVERQLRAAHEHGQARWIALGRQPLVRALSRLQAEARDVPGRRRVARALARGDDDDRRALFGSDGGPRLRIAHRLRAPAARVRRQAEERPAGRSSGRPRREGLRGAGGPARLLAAGSRGAVPTTRVRLERPSPRWRREFLSAVRRSRALHARWVSPPATPAAYGAY